MKRTIFFIVLLFIFAFSGTTSALTITAMDNAQNLAQALVGSGVTISNVTYTGVNAASGYFTGGTAAGLGFNSGIVLTSGYASNLNHNSNTSDAITGSNGLAGDANLNSLIPGFTTFDATVLQFDFMVATGTSVYFNYIFGSDEYNEYVNSSFNDVFGFFFNNQNIALIPGTTTPVSINNVNGGNNAQYYHNNDPSDLNPTPYAFEYDGFTSMFTATLNNLIANQTYHIKLAIADAGDTILDSGVFLQASSFTNTPPNPIPEPATMFLLGSGLIGLVSSRRKFFKK